ncbi:MAG: hypothetical protein AB9891_19390 [Anaerolineaceae bacterium]
MDEPVPVKKKLPTWAIILIVLGVIALCICIIVPTVLSLLGPAIGSTFGDITNSIQP